MTSLEERLSILATQLKHLRDAIPVDEAVVGVTIEPHDSAFTRLRAPKGRTLANGKRTMRLKAEDVPLWEQKIYARNQRTKVAQCLDLIERATAVAQGVSWDWDEGIERVNDLDIFTTRQTEAVAVKGKIAQPLPRFRYVFKNAKGASPFNRTVHAISEERPASGRWYSSALCGERPKAGSWGWDTAPDNELSCPKCVAKLKALGVGP